MDNIDVTLIQLIGAIYDAVIEPEKWHDALDGIRRHFRLHNVMMALNDIRAQTASLSVLVNIPDHWAAAMAKPEYNAELVNLLGGPESVGRMPLEEPITTLSVTNQQALESNKYFIDLAEPEGLIDSIGIFLTRDRFRIGNVGLGRHRDEGPITEDVLVGLRIIAPHLRRAALITGILDEERKQRTMFEAVVNAVRSSVVIVDGRANIIHANAAAREAMANGNPLVDRMGRLDIKGEIVPGGLAAAILAAAEGDGPLGRRGIAIPGTRTDSEPFVVHVLPLNGRCVRSGVPGEAVAAVFVAERGDDPKYVLDAAAMLYNLSPAETRIFELTINGRDSQEIARTLSISPNTLKSHTRHLLEKTGQQRRVDLVRLAASLRPAVKHS
ncbi:MULTISPECIES: helix-turn-helix transcriptional regulator [unclassified Mesorhizobium]|uniref:helix-turn-helix transcriptional regulator n=1 Tax=unclassified Mesorhizobium TaxID=325217 RepID=UPI001CCDD964|nr:MULTISPECIES: helix-turn-helix transcriptional regulator [unclassified Mesorhizobium]MBZ9739740.1 helix-turn-helix transcriptional regulator [Mesorhizobium sp. CO1-1-4]MBZ9804996.1 helix-turn-helix transcriptional regulator [Mesorhizobium sp. ES1-6]